MVAIRPIIFTVILIVLTGWPMTPATAQISKSPSKPAEKPSVKVAGNPSLPPPPPIQAYFGPKASDDPQGVLFNLLRFFDSAKVSIYGSAHEIDLIAVAEKLAARAEAGVDVQIVVESRWLNLPKDRAAIDILKKSKVRLFPDTKKSGLMHNKFFIADKAHVWTGSTNLTEHCLLFNYNNGIWIDNDRVAQNFLTEFYEEREGKFGRRGSGRANTPFPVTTVGNARVATFFSPEDNPLPQIVGLIGRAKKSIDLMCFVFSSEEISDALLAAQKRGVTVRVLLDNSFSAPGAIGRWRYVPFKELSKAGISCKYDDEAAKIHHKVIVVDGHEVLTGSFNLSNNAAKSNDENLLIVDSGEIGAKYQAEFERLWAFFNGDPGKAPEPDDEDQENGAEAGTVADGDDGKDDSTDAKSEVAPHKDSKDGQDGQENHNEKNHK